MYASAVAGAVRLEERFAEEDSDSKFVNRAKRQEHSKQRNGEDTRDRWQSKIQHLLPAIAEQSR